MRSTTILCGLAIASSLISGCSKAGPQKAEVSGSVSLNGVAIEEGSIQFIPVDGTTGPGAGGVIKNGKYHISLENGVMVGKNRVELRAFGPSGKKIQDPTALPGVMTESRVQVFPPEYNESSTVIKEVKAGSNSIDFEIRTDGK
jgi:hypothetical protein